MKVLLQNPYLDPNFSGNTKITGKRYEKKNAPPPVCIARDKGYSSIVQEMCTNERVNKVYEDIIKVISFHFNLLIINLI